MELFLSRSVLVWTLFLCYKNFWESFWWRSYWCLRCPKFVQATFLFQNWVLFWWNAVSTSRHAVGDIGIDTILLLLGYVTQNCYYFPWGRFTAGTWDSFNWASSYLFLHHYKPSWLSHIFCIVYNASSLLYR